MKKVDLLCLIAIGLVTGLAGSAHGAALVRKDGGEIHFKGWSQAGWAYDKAPGADSGNNGPYVGLARLSGTAERGRWGRAFVQIAAESGTALLLDAVAAIRPTPSVTVQAGVFKVPLSRDFLIPAPATGFVNRSLSVGLTWKRAPGAMLTLGGGDDLPLSLHLGAFQPPDAVVAGAGVDQGKILAAAADLAVGDVGLHLAFTDLVGTDATADGLPYDQHVDAAVTWLSSGWTVFAEVLAALDSPADKTPVGAYVQALRSMPLGDADLAIEPGLRVGMLRPLDGVTVQRVTAGLTLYLDGDHLNTSLNVDLTSRDGESGQAAYAQLQAGF